MRLLGLTVVAAAFACGCTQRLVYEPPATAQEIEALVRTIDDKSDPLHSDLTPAIHELVDIGERVIPRMLDLMLLDGEYDSFTRLHASTVLWRITFKKCKSRSDGADHDFNAIMARANALWKSLGDLDHDSPLADREQAVKLWRAWYEGGCKA